MSSIATDILIIVVAGLLGGVLSRRCRQPLILGYIIAGVLVGPFTTGLVADVADIEKLADIGVALLLFSLGLEFPLKNLKPIKNIAFFGSLIQVGLTFIYGAVLGKLFGWQWTPAFWFATAIVSSSTAVILKTLTNQGHAESLSGRIMLGMSIVQDLSVIPIMILLASIYGMDPENGNWLLAIARPIWHSVIFVLVMGVVGSRMTSTLLGMVARLNSRELFLLTITVLGLGVGALTQLFGLSFAFGAFVSGMVLSESDYSHRALSELVPIRDLFALLFFVSVGMLFDPLYLVHHWLAVFGIMFLVVFGRGLILMMISYVLGYRKVVPLALFFGMLPISEISFVLIQTASSLGAIDNDLYSLILAVTVVSMLLGPLLANATDPVYKLFKKHSNTPQAEPVNLMESGLLRDHVIITGSNDYIPLLGEAMLVTKLKHLFIVSDYTLFCRLKNSGVSAIFGDPLLESVLLAARVEQSRLLLVTNTSLPEARRIIELGHQFNPSLAVVAHGCNDELSAELERLAVNEVIQPQREATVEMFRQILLRLNINEMDVAQYLDLLRKRFEISSNQEDVLSAGQWPELAGLFNTASLLVTEDSILNGCCLRDSDIRSRYLVSVVAVIRHGQILPNPAADFLFQAGDRIVVMGKLEDCRAFADGFCVSPA